MHYALTRPNILINSIIKPKGNTTVLPGSLGFRLSSIPDPSVSVALLIAGALVEEDAALWADGIGSWF